VGRLQKHYRSIAALRAELDRSLLGYNIERLHQRRYNRGRPPLRVIPGPQMQGKGSRWLSWLLRVVSETRVLLLSTKRLGRLVLWPSESGPHNCVSIFYADYRIEPVEPSYYDGEVKFKSAIVPKSDPRKDLRRMTKSPNSFVYEQD